MLTFSCSPADLAAFMVTTKLTVPPVRYARLLVQVTTGDAWAVYAVSDPSSPLAVAGLYAWPDRETEAWFMADASRASGSMPQVLMALRRVLRAEAPRHERGIVARVAPGSRAGATIVRCLGFAHGGDEIWRFAGERGEGALRRRQR